MKFLRCTIKISPFITMSITYHQDFMEEGWIEIEIVAVNNVETVVLVAIFN